MGKAFEAHDKLVKEVFEGDYQFEIPEYQRPYAWTTEQAEELFNDLVTAMREASPSGTISPYFLGSIVLIKSEYDPKSSVVDGQQRLSTITMLLAVLRSLMPGAADDITDFLYKKGKASLGETNQYRLSAREEDAVFFRSFVQEPGGITRLVANMERLTDSKLRYRENAILLMEMAKAISVSDREALWKFLAGHCSLVVISTPDPEAAYRIFSVLNNRGLDLAPLDIIKAEVLGTIRRTLGPEKGKAYAFEWSQVESLLGRDAFGELLVHIRAIYAKQKQRASLVKEFQESVSEYKRPTELIDGVIKPYSVVWANVRDADFKATQDSDSINDTLNWLNRLAFKDWVPPALVYFNRFKGQPPLLRQFLEGLERLSYFLLVTRAGINDRIETFAALTGEVEATAFTGDSHQLITLRLDERKQREFAAALDGDIYRRLPRGRMDLVLRLEALVSDGSKKQSFSQVSLEHVLPQTPPANSEWVRWFPDEEERDAWTHRLANLVPLHFRKNPAAGNLPFAAKKDVYFKGHGSASPFTLTQEVRFEASWTPTLLIERQKRLVGILKKHWELEIGVHGGDA